MNRTFHAFFLSLIYSLKKDQDCVQNSSSSSNLRSTSGGVHIQMVEIRGLLTVTAVTGTCTSGGNKSAAFTASLFL